MDSLLEFRHDFFSFSSEEEKSRCQEIICNLQSILDSEREKSGFVSEQRLKLQQENEQLQKEMEGLRKLAVEAQKKAKIKVWFMCGFNFNIGLIFTL